MVQASVLSIWDTEQFFPFRSLIQAYFFVGYNFDEYNNTFFIYKGMIQSLIVFRFIVEGNLKHHFNDGDMYETTF
jgi:hypothetical protein